jgi:hypothetical protein
MAKRKSKPTKAELTVIANGKLVSQVMEMKGWKTLIEPLFDEMITSVIGVKKNNRWLTGHMVKSRKDEKKEFYIGYLCGLQELWNSIQNYSFSAEVVKKRIEESNELEDKEIIPMVNDHEEDTENTWKV